MTPLRHDDTQRAKLAKTAHSTPFQFECPLTVFKADAAPEGKQRRIAGVVSTDNVDRQKERILQDGLDWEPLLAGGWLNDNHLQGTTDILGYPETVSYHEKGSALPDGSKAEANCHWVEGYLLDTKKADDVWELAQALAKTNRRLGYSVEGSIEERTGPNDSIIAKAKVRNVAITNCFPGDAKVSGIPLAVSRRLYSGPMVNLKLKGGNHLTGTPNHPIFTNVGWVPLGSLNKAKHRVASDCGDAFGIPASKGDIDKVPTTLEQIFAASQVGGTMRSVSGSAEDFHGDGMADGDVDVVSVPGELQNDLSSMFLQKFGQDNLPTTDKLSGCLSSSGSCDQFCARCRGACSCFDGGGKSSLFKLFGVSSLSDLLDLRSGSGDAAIVDCSNHQGLADVKVGSEHSRSRSSKVSLDEVINIIKCQLVLSKDNSAPSLDIPLSEVSTNSVVSEAQLLSDAGRCLTSKIHFDEIIDIGFSDFSGHVYNLETSLGWYETNRILTKNCPVNTDSRLEILARSLSAHNGVLRRAMSLADNTGNAGPCKPNKAYSGQGSGQVLSREALSPRKKKSRNKDVILSRSEAVSYVRQQVPGCSEALARAIVLKTLNP